MTNQLFINKKFRPDLKNLSISAAMVKECCEKLTLDEKTSRHVDLAVSEAVSNAIRHAENSKESSVVLTLVSDGKKLIIEVEDNGPGFDFKNVSKPDLEKAHEGGYGLYLIKHVMDSVVYETGINANVLIMEKDISDSRTEEI
ncbi:ATP-binding protein [Maridesulfovibrio zosterae]|uniref:ATP-binding protein n=1 Tax=Maridesulfovibrio zosterae TaxID=82171 RepID=UPI000416D7FB|nr:ATP-binding protein [Maridesulfovibrio zosterae]